MSAHPFSRPFEVAQAEGEPRSLSIEATEAERAALAAAMELPEIGRASCRERVYHPV